MSWLGYVVTALVAGLFGWTLRAMRRGTSSGGQIVGEPQAAVEQFVGRNQLTILPCDPDEAGDRSTGVVGQSQFDAARRRRL